MVVALEYFFLLGGKHLYPTPVCLTNLKILQSLDSVSGRRTLLFFLGFRIFFSFYFISMETRRCQLLTSALKKWQHFTALEFMRRLSIVVQDFDGKQWRLVYTATMHLLLMCIAAFKLLDKGCVHS